MKIGIVTDAWRPQTNGVVTTLTRTAAGLAAFGHEVRMMTPEGLRTIPCPSYPEIRLALAPGRAVRRWLDAECPDAVHVATEGPLGLAVRRLLARRRQHFTTSYHTRFPQYVRARLPIPERVSYAALRWFHGGAARTLVATPAVRRELEVHGFRNLVYWSRGVDTDLFRPRPDAQLPYPRPILMYVGRVAVEKNVEAFLEAAVVGTKVIVGGGPALARLQARYPAAVFTGYRHGEALAETLATADCFVFPSRTDTFGLVMLEALACGVPVAAYPVTGPIDVLRPNETGVMDPDLVVAIRGALRLDRGQCRADALRHCWEAATGQFLSHLVRRTDGLPLVATPPAGVAKCVDGAETAGFVPAFDAGSAGQKT